MPQPSKALQALFKKEMTCEKDSNLNLNLSRGVGGSSEAAEEVEEDLREELSEGANDFSK